MGVYEREYFAYWGQVGGDILKRDEVGEVDEQGLEDRNEEGLRGYVQGQKWTQSWQ